MIKDYIEPFFATSLATVDGAQTLKLNLAKCIAALVFSVCMTNASAGVITYSATVDNNDPLFSDFARMDLQPFWVGTSAIYVLEAISGNFDTFFYLYSGIPDLPADSFTEIVRNDDGGAGLLSRISIALDASTQYTLGVRGFGGAQGSFTAAISGVGDITLGVLSDAQVPVPASLALVSLGLVGLSWKRRRRN